jgi:hypothetical protein
LRTNLPSVRERLAARPFRYLMTMTRSSFARPRPQDRGCRLRRLPQRVASSGSRQQKNHGRRTGERRQARS